MTEDLGGVLENILKELQAVREENKSLQSQIEGLKKEPPRDPEAGMTLSGLGDRVARSVTIVTRPVADRPEDPLWGNHKVATDGLVKNSLSGGMKGAKE